MISLKGKSVCSGIAKGPLLLFIPGTETESVSAGLSPEEELKRLDAACEKAK